MLKNREATACVASFGLLVGVGAVSSHSVGGLSESERPQVEAVVGHNDTGVSTFNFLPPATLDGPPIQLCFMPGTSKRVMDQVNAGITARWEKERANRDDDDGTIAYNADDRWSGTAQGQPIILRWSVVPDGLFIPDAVGEGGGNSVLRNRLTQIFGTYEAGLDRIRLMFDRWSELTGITYIEVSDDGAQWGAPGPYNGSGGRGDVRLSMKNFANQFGGVLAYNFFPDNGDMVLNSDHVNNYGNSSGNYRFLRNVMAHEHGHGMGLSHVCPQNSTKLMEPAANTNFDGPMHDDIRGGQRSYGDRFEPNDTVGIAANLGTVTNSLDETNLSVDDNADFDFYRFTVDSGKQVTISVQPIGFTYPDWDQNQFTGACNTSGPTVNSLTIHNLRLQLIGTNGTTILADRDVNPAGQSESVVDFVLPSGGTFFLRVTGSLNDDIQIYNLSIDVEDAPLQEGFVDWTNLSVVFGTLLSGDLSSIESSDDAYLRVRSIFGFTALEPNINEITLIGTSPFNTVSQLDLKIESRINHPSGTAKIRMRNFDTNGLVNVLEYNLTATDTLVELDNLPDPDRFVRDSDGRVEMRVKHVVIAVFTATGFVTNHDWIAVRAVD